MTYGELGIQINALSKIDKNREAVVFPPEGCPHAKPVAITELHVELRKDNRANTVTILTGKMPE